MAQNNILSKILSIITKGPSRTLHSKNSKCLHNAASTSHTVDSMSRVHAKLYGGAECDKNPGIRTRVGPTQAVLETVGGRKPVEVVPQMPEKSNKVVMEDPNGTMWQLYKKDRNNSVNLKKMKRNISTMKKNIKDYYVNRLNQDQTTFQEVEETFKIGKINDRKADRRRWREEQIEKEMMENEGIEAEPEPVLMKKVPKKSLFSKLQDKNVESKVEESKEEPQGAFRNYTQESKRKLEKEKLESEDKEAIWMQKKEAEPKKSSAPGEEMVKSPLFNFKFDSRNRATDKLHLSGMIFKQRAVEGRQFSTMASRYVLRAKPRPIQDHLTRAQYLKYEPKPLVLQRHITSSVNSMKSRITEGNVGDRALSTCSKYYTDNNDHCRPKTVPPQEVPSAHKGYKIPKCPRGATYEWGPCDKITLCGCYPPNERVTHMNCGKELTVKLTCGKKPEYKCPSFSECTKIVELRKKPVNCCERSKMCKYRMMGQKKQFTFAIERMEESLGQKYWTANRCTTQRLCFSTVAQGRRNFSTTTGVRGLPSLTPARPEPPALVGVLRNLVALKNFSTSSPVSADEAGDKKGKGNGKTNGDKESDEECQRKKAGALPCLKAVKILGIKKKNAYQGKGSCERICLPCCQPARDPPECLSPYVKPPCTKFRNPRPSFSECRKMFPMKHYKCECEVPKKPICDDKKKKEGGECTTC